MYRSTKQKANESKHRLTDIREHLGGRSQAVVVAEVVKSLVVLLSEGKFVSASANELAGKLIDTASVTLSLEIHSLLHALLTGSASNESGDVDLLLQVDHDGLLELLHGLIVGVLVRADGVPLGEVDGNIRKRNERSVH